MPVLVLFSILSPLIPLSLGYRNRWTLLWVYPLVSLVFDLSISYFKRVEGLTAEWPINLYLGLEGLLLVTVFSRRLFPRRLVQRRWVLALILWTFVITAIAQGPLRYHHLGAIGFYLLYILLSLAGLYSIIRNPSVVYLEKSWFFWFAAGILIYASGSFLLFLFRPYLVEVAPEFFALAWHSIFQLLNIIKNIMIGLALYHYKPVRD